MTLFGDPFACDKPAGTPSRHPQWYRSRLRPIFKDVGFPLFIILLDTESKTSLPSFSLHAWRHKLRVLNVWLTVVNISAFDVLPNEESWARPRFLYPISYKTAMSKGRSRFSCSSFPSTEYDYLATISNPSPGSLSLPLSVCLWTYSIQRYWNIYLKYLTEIFTQAFLTAHYN